MLYNPVTMKLCVLNLRGLDAGHLGPYGNRWIDTPALNLLASQAVLFDAHYSTHPDDESARWVWRTGCHRFPTLDGAPANEGWPDLLALLRGVNVPTRLLLDSSRSSPSAFESGWDVVHGADGLDEMIHAGKGALAALSRGSSGLLWIESAALLPPWAVEERFTEPYFNTPESSEDEGGDGGEDEPGAEDVEVEPLEPLFDPPTGPVDAEDDVLFEVIQTTYGAAISQLDAALAELLDGLGDDIVLLVTSDHGQALAERGVVGPVRPWLHAEIVQVPLLLHLPGRDTRRRVPELTLSIDIAPTVAALFGLDLPGAHGRNLLPLVTEAVPGWREYVCLGAQAGDEIEWGLITERWALRVPIAPPEQTPKLYVKPDDRGEVNDVSQHQIDDVDALLATLRAYVQATSRPGELDVPPLKGAATARES